MSDGSDPPMLQLRHTTRDSTTYPRYRCTHRVRTTRALVDQSLVASSESMRSIIPSLLRASNALFLPSRKASLENPLTIADSLSGITLQYATDRRLCSVAGCCERMRGLERGVSPSDASKVVGCVGHLDAKPPCAASDSPEGVGTMAVTLEKAVASRRLRCTSVLTWLARLPARAGGGRVAVAAPPFRNASEFSSGHSFASLTSACFWDGSVSSSSAPCGACTLQGVVSNVAGCTLCLPLWVAHHDDASAEDVAPTSARGLTSPQFHRRGALRCGLLRRGSSLKLVMIDCIAQAALPVAPSKSSMAKCSGFEGCLAATMSAHVAVDEHKVLILSENFPGHLPGSQCAWSFGRRSAAERPGW